MGREYAEMVEGVWVWGGAGGDYEGAAEVWGAEEGAGGVSVDG